jgi:hypothetical protein
MSLASIFSISFILFGVSCKSILKGNPTLLRSSGVLNFLGNLIDDSNVNLLFVKARSPIVVTLSGIVIELSKLD